MKTQDELAAIIGEIRSGAVPVYGLPRDILTETGERVGRLVPLVSGMVTAELCEAMYQWRSRHAALFLSHFENSPERVRDWLTAVVLPDHTRQPFLIYSASGDLIGIHGICEIEPHSAELDTMMRGRSGGHKDLMSAAQLALIDWTFDTLQIDGVYGHVLSGNFLVRRFHSAFGLTEAEVVPLIKKSTDDGYIYQPAPNASEKDVDESLITIRLERAAFYEKFGASPALCQTAERSIGCG